MNKKLFQKKTKYLKLSNGGSGLAVKWMVKTHENAVDKE
jgi:hypothetical protein